MKKLFLKWNILNLLTVFLATLAFTYGRDQVSSLTVTGASFVIAAAIVYALGAVRCGLLAWRSDQVTKADSVILEVEGILHEAKFVKFCSDKVPLLGLIGCGLGIFIALHNNLHNVEASQLQEAVSECMAAAGIAFISTITGIYVCLALAVQHFVLTHELQKI